MASVDLRLVCKTCPGRKMPEKGGTGRAGGGRGGEDWAGASLIFNGGVGNLPRSGKSCFLLVDIDHYLFSLSFFPQSRRRRGPAMCVALSQNSIFSSNFGCHENFAIEHDPNVGHATDSFPGIRSKGPSRIACLRSQPQKIWHRSAGPWDALSGAKTASSVSRCQSSRAKHTRKATSEA